MTHGLLSAEALSKITVRDAGYQAIPITDRESWLERRHRDVTASVAACLLGAHEYMTPLQLWTLKAGRFEAGEEETPPMRRGRLLEPVALQLIGEEHPDWKVERGTHYYRDAKRRIGATPDAFVFDPNRTGFGILQVKTVEPSVFRRKWRAEDGTTEPPLWIAVQALVECELTGASWACVAAMTCGFGLDLHLIEIPLHAGVLARLYDAIADFWRAVEINEPPSADFSKDGALLASLFKEDDGTVIDLSGENQLPALADEDRHLSDEIKQKTGRRKEIKTELLSKMGVASVAMINGVVFATATTVHKKAYPVVASSFRDVRFKDIDK